jgi:hypothetical protein
MYPCFRCLFFSSYAFTMTHSGMLQLQLIERFLQGKLELDNLQLKPEALDELDLPIKAPVKPSGHSSHPQTHRTVAEVPTARPGRSALDRSAGWSSTSHGPTWEAAQSGAVDPSHPASPATLPNNESLTDTCAALTPRQVQDRRCLSPRYTRCNAGNIHEQDVVVFCFGDFNAHCCGELTLSVVSAFGCAFQESDTVAFEVGRASAEQLLILTWLEHLDVWRGRRGFRGGSVAPLTLGRSRI